MEVLGAAVIALVSAVAVALLAYRGKRDDNETVAATTARTAYSTEVTKALEAWDEIVAQLRTDITNLRAENAAMKADLERCVQEHETTRLELADLRRQVEAR